MNMIYKLKIPEHHRTAIQSVVEMLYTYSFVAVKEMTGSSHTITSCLSKLRSCLKAGKKQLRVWLQYVCDVAKVLLYSSFSGPLVLLWSPHGDSEMARNGALWATYVQVSTKRALWSHEPMFMF